MRDGETTKFSFSSKQDLQFIEAVSCYHLLHVHFTDKIIDSFINAFLKFLNSVNLHCPYIQGIIWDAGIQR